MGFFLSFFSFVYTRVQMAHRSSSNGNVVVKHVLQSSSSSSSQWKKVAILTSGEFHQQHICHCFDFIALYWARECRAGRQQFTNTVVPFTVKVCLSFLLMRDITQEDNRCVRRLLVTRLGCFPCSMSVETMFRRMSIRRFPELRVS